ncbi:MAG: glycosyltransferase family 2 protein [Bacteroidota bacterium]
MADQVQPTGEQQPGKPPEKSRPYYRYRRRRFQRPPRQKRQPEQPIESVSVETHQPVSTAHPEHPQKPIPPVQIRKPDISVVIPLFNEAESLPDLSRQLRDVLQHQGGNYEVIFVDDGSTDNSYQILRDIHRINRRMKAIRFRRNFGKSAALAVGFTHAEGAIIVTMDADLQDDPTEIPNLVKKIREGYDLVSGWKKKRYDPITKIISSRFFNFVTSVMTGFRLHDFNCGLKAYRSEVLKEIEVYGELHRFIPALVHWRGFRVGEIPVQHHRRKYGKTKFGPGRFLKGFLDLLTMLFTTRYIRRPLHLFGGWGIFSFLAGFCIDLWLSIEWLLNLTALSNRPIFFLGILFMIVGIQFISIGLLGEMISKGQQTHDSYSIREKLL